MTLEELRDRLDEIQHAVEGDTKVVTLADEGVPYAVKDVALDFSSGAVVWLWVERE